MDWHKRYLQQAQWTRELREYLFKQAGWNGASRALEVGCGTGAILSELPDHAGLHGLDIDRAALAQCQVHAPAAVLAQGDALRLPYRSETFDIVHCHFLLLWVKDPLQALREMKRAAKTGGHVLAFAEPDYTSRLDEPPALMPLGRWQAESLVRQGADPGLGGRLADLFSQAGLRLIETGTIQNVVGEPSPEEWEMEWAVLESDLAGVVPGQQIQEMRRLDRQARARGTRRLHVPTYFAWGQAQEDL
jgi:SAM-dependent methyltransferase